VIEADTTNAEEALALAQRSRDLSIDDASIACRQSALAVASSLQGRDRAFRPLRVLLCDSMQPLVTGGGNVITVRERVN